MHKLTGEQVKVMYKQAGILRDSMRRIWRRILMAPPPKPRNVSSLDFAIRKYINKHGISPAGLQSSKMFPLPPGRQFKVF